MGQHDCWRQGHKLRTLLDVDLIDVAAVTYPAYKSGTSVDARTAAPASREIRSKLDDLIWNKDLTAA